ncbi:MAG: hypothetical protein R3E44_16480 [Paracoccaceae bacterium]
MAIFVVANSGLALAAGNSCPDPDDLSTGIRAEYSDGGVVDVRSAGGGAVELFEPDAGTGPDGLLFHSLHGLYDTRVAYAAAGTEDPDRSLVYDYSVDPAELPVPEQGESWLGGVTTTWPDGSKDYETAVYVFGRADRRKIGDCDYAAIPVKASFMDGDDWVAQDFIYFSDLGFAIATGIQSADDESPLWRAVVSLSPLGR